jgi:hypothetical protein
LFHLYVFSTFCFFNIRSTMVSKHSLHAKRQARDRYGRFSSPSSRTTSPPSCQELGSSSRRRIAPPPLRMQEVGTSSRHRTAPLVLQLGRLGGDVGGSCSSSSNTRLGVPPPPRGEVILNTHSRFQLFSRITKCIPSFLD